MARGAVARARSTRGAGTRMRPRSSFVAPWARSSSVAESLWTSIPTVTRRSRASSRMRETRASSRKRRRGRMALARQTAAEAAEEAVHAVEPPGVAEEHERALPVHDLAPPLPAEGDPLRAHRSGAAPAVHPHPAHA